MGTIKCTAWDCIGKYADLIDNTHSIRIVGGRTIYEMAYPVKGYQRVLLCYLEDTDNGHLRQVNRYVSPDTPVELIPIEK